MAQTHQLLGVCYHYDDDTGMHRVGEIDFGVNYRLKEYEGIRRRCVSKERE